MIETYFKKVNQTLYKIIGPENSSRLAYGFIGKTIFNIFSGKNSYKIYKLDNGIKLKLKKEEAKVLGVFFLGLPFPLETQYLYKVLKPGDVFIDVGTYVDGWHSLVASKIVGGNGQVYCFEPHPFFYKRLIGNISLNGCKNVIAEQLALSDKKVLMNLYEGEGITSFSRSHVEGILQKEVKAVKVKTITLDEYVKKKNITKVTLIKIDVEGYEMNVLKGAYELLKGKNAPDILAEIVDEYLKKSGSSEKEILSYLNKLGYKQYVATKEGLIKKFLPEDGRSGVEMLFFSKKRLLKKTFSFHF